MAAADLYYGHWRKAEAFMVIFSLLASHKQPWVYPLGPFIPYPIQYWLENLFSSGMCGIYLVVSKGLQNFADCFYLLTVPFISS